MFLIDRLLKKISFTKLKGETSHLFGNSEQWRNYKNYHVYKQGYSTVPMAGAKEKLSKFTFSPCGYAYYDNNFTPILKLVS
jgi:hypothetical protein